MFGIRATSITRAPARRVHLVPLLACWLCLAVRIPAARAQTAPEIWSIQLDGGVFAPVEASGASPTAGMRYCKHLGSHLQSGLLTAWAFKRAKLETTAGGQEGPVTHVELARADARLVPLMGFLQVDLTDRAWLVPFAGIGAGYEWLVLHAVDYRTGQQSKVAYGNVAWQTYGGVGLRLTSKVRLNSELYYNGGSLERAVRDPNGPTRREAIHVNGVGARVGLDMKFE